MWTEKRLAHCLLEREAWDRAQLRGDSELQPGAEKPPEYVLGGASWPPPSDPECSLFWAQRSEGGMTKYGNSAWAGAQMPALARVSACPSRPGRGSWLKTNLSLFTPRRATQQQHISPYFGPRVHTHGLDGHRPYSTDMRW